MNTEAIALGICVGVAATFTMDVLASAFRKMGVAVGARGIWVGRWYLGMVRGRFIHSNIAEAPVLPGEGRAAFVGHYAIGITLAVAYIAGTSQVGVSPDGILVALGYGFATSVFPWFLVFPALGFGWLGLKGPSELRLFRTSLLNHLSYGFGLWWIAMVLPLG
jgi:hypothetical protein